MAPRQILIAAFPQAELLDIACPSDVFDAANRLRPKPAYEIRLGGLDGRPIRCQSGITLTPEVRLDQVTGPLDTLVVAGGLGHLSAAEDGRVLAQLRRLAKASRRVASVCTGATLLAAAGLLTGRRCTTHWADAPRLAAQFPDIEVDPAPLYVRDGEVYTSAGVTSGLDLALALVEQDHGPSLSRQIARYLVAYLQRPGNQAQVSMFLTAPAPEHHVVRDLTAHIASHLDTDLGTPALAARAGLSTRQLSRLFDTHLGTTPGKHVRRVRTETAAQLLSTTDLPLSAVARRCGFGSTESLRQSFLDHYDTPPSAYRRLHRGRQGAFT
ncbi:DJ-1/PfpI family protein [Saccharothrix sp. AJ9571]|nr:DJ-1/PfpI family protein [Saccharothrix sp. AJ9571]